MTVYKISLSNFDLSEISKYRSQLMGIAAILVLIVHSYVHCKSVMSPLVCKLLEQGNYGVDIFFFLSGMGLTYSFNKLRNGRDGEKTSAILFWEIHRLKRIFVPYLLITTLCTTISLLIGNTSPDVYILNYFTISFWVYGDGAWFVSTLVVLYLLFPFIYELLFSRKYGVHIAICLSFVIMIVCQYEDKEGIVRNVLMGMVRTPSFYIGIVMTKFIKDGYSIPCNYLILYTLLVMLLTVFLKIAFPMMYSKWMLIIPVIWVFVLFIKRFKTLYKIGSFMGVISLESYLFNVYLGYLVNQPIMIMNHNINYGNIFEYTMVLVLGTIFSLYAHKLSNRLLI